MPVDTGVTPVATAVGFAGVMWFWDTVVVRVRVVGSAVPGVRRPLTLGVILPLTGVTRPLDIEGVFRPVEAEDMELGMRTDEGVSLPLRTEATEAGRDTLPSPTVGVESLSAPMKTPQLGGQVKYRLLRNREVSNDCVRRRDQKCGMEQICDAGRTLSEKRMQHLTRLTHQTTRRSCPAPQNLRATRHLQTFPVCPQLSQDT